RGTSSSTLFPYTTLFRSGNAGTYARRGLVVSFADMLVWFAAAWWLAASGFLCLSIVAAFLQPVLQRRRARGEELPPITLVVPVKDRKSTRLNPSHLVISY